jgi:hypothetical protein
MALLSPLRGRRTSFALIGLTLGVTMTACGGSGTARTQVASLGSVAVDAASATSTPVDTQDAWLAFAQCMRDNGVDMQDPTFDANGNVQGGFGPGSGVDPGDPATRTAMDACGDLIQAIGPGGGNGGPRFDRTAMQDAFNAFTGCLRDAGLQVDDIDMSVGPGGGPRPDGAGPNGSVPAGALPAGAATGGSVPAGGFTPPPGAPNGPPGGPGGDGFDPSARIIEQLGLDDTDPAVIAALDTCQPQLDAAFTPPDASSTATTVAGS